MIDSLIFTVWRSPFSALATRDVLLIAFVLAGQGLGAALGGQIEPELRQKRLVFLPVEVPWLKLSYGFILKRGRTPSPAAVAFMEAVRTIERDIVA